jgi:NhaA family Na+:H+ antiporter
MNDVIRDFFKMESAGGILLVIAAAIAMTIANSPLGETYQSVLHTYVFGMSVSHWINDGLMAVFFLLIGLEVKRELLEGALKSKKPQFSCDCSGWRYINSCSYLRSL